MIDRAHNARVIDWTRVSRSVTQLMVMWVGGEIQERIGPKKPSAPDTASETQPGVRPGCPVCQIDDALWEARGKLEQVVWLSAPNGEMPQEVRPLVLLARQSMERARGMVVELRRQTPKLGEPCDLTIAAIDQALVSLPEPSTMTVPQAQAAAGAIEGANRQAGALALRYYQADRDHQGHQRTHCAV